MIDQSELDRLSQEYQQASEYRKNLEAQYEQPVDMDSWGMELMEESAWLKNSATENLSGGWKAVADTAINVGQDVALLPLLAGGAKMYVAGVAANKSAETMFEQTEKGKPASDAFGSGVLTAGAEVVKGKLADTKIPVSEAIKAIEIGGETFVEKFLQKAISSEVVSQEIIPKITKETVNYFLDFLAEKAGRDPNAQFSVFELIQSGIANGIAGFVGEETKKFYKLLDKVWAADQ